ncbi:MAG: hypothetical protein AB7F35_03020 [Acetobacteraceae bacterium]
MRILSVVGAAVSAVVPGTATSTHANLCDTPPASDVIIAMVPPMRSPTDHDPCAHLAAPPGRQPARANGTH